MASASLWTWPETQVEPLGGSPDITGFKVVANDGEIGHIDSFAIAPDEAHLVIDTGGWLFGRMSLIPAAAGIRDMRPNSQPPVSMTRCASSGAIAKESMWPISPSFATTL